MSDIPGDTLVRKNGLTKVLAVDMRYIERECLNGRGYTVKTEGVDRLGVFSVEYVSWAS